MCPIKGLGSLTSVPCIQPDKEEPESSTGLLASSVAMAGWSPCHNMAITIFCRATTALPCALGTVSLPRWGAVALFMVPVKLVRLC